MSQKTNHIDSAEPPATMQQKWLMHIYEEVKTTPQGIDNCLKENACKLPKTMTQHDYLTNMANAIIDDDTGKELNYHQISKNTKHQKIWKQSFANKLGRLSQGTGGQIEVTNTMFFIAHDQMPRDRLKDVSYGSIIVDYRFQKEEPHRTRLTVGGNLIDQAGDVSTPTEDTTTSRLMINIITPGAI